MGLLAIRRVIRAIKLERHTLGTVSSVHAVKRDGSDAVAYKHISLQLTMKYIRNEFTSEFLCEYTAIHIQ